RQIVRRGHRLGAIDIRAIDDTEVSERPAVVDVDQQSARGRRQRLLVYTDRCRVAGFGAQGGHDQTLRTKANAMNTAARNAPDRWGIVMVSSPYSARLPPRVSGAEVNLEPQEPGG